MAWGRSISLFVAMPLALAAVPLAAQSSSSAWEGLVEVRAKTLDKVYLAPGADFSGYTKVMIDPTQVAFRKNWQRDQNRDSLDLSAQVTDRDARRILDEAMTGFQKEFADAYTRAGFQVVTTPGPDVLRLSTAVVNLDVNAPDVHSAGRSRSYARRAGEATLVLEARDSVTGALLGRALDRRETDEVAPYVRNSVTNRAAFEDLFRTWARTSADGLTEIKTTRPPAR